MILAVIVMNGCSENEVAIPLATGTAPGSTNTPTSEPTATPTDTPSPAPSPTPMPTLTPTPTPIPLGDLMGTVFFDYNGSGLQEENEPALADLEICAELPENGENVCTQTDAGGNFQFVEIAPDNSPVHLRPINGDPEQHNTVFRYITAWQENVTIPAYEIDEYEIPEQSLNRTQVVDFDEGFPALVGQNLELGLLQGLVTYPFIEEEFDSLAYITGYDHDPRPGLVIDHIGDITPCSSFFECEEKPTDTLSPFKGVWDTHGGIDYQFDGQDKITIVASHDGYVKEIRQDKDDKEIHFEISTSPDGNIVRPGDGIVTTYQHCQVVAVNNDDLVLRGQIVGYIFRTEFHWHVYSWHLHHGLVFGEPFEQFAYPNPYYKPFYAMEVPEFRVDGLNDYSAWTVWNTPQFALAAQRN
jgi:murein DD-endopeptidase MepM/ murein hydrolase activator NlpD